MKTQTKRASWIAIGLAAITWIPSAHALTAEEGFSLLFMKQEEKLARDIYQALGARWDHPSFSRIAVSEQRHLDAIDRLIAIFGLNDTAPAETGKFTYPELQSLYDDLTARGAVSLTEALQVGVLVEETDIADLKEAILATREPAVLRVFTQLLNASQNHLAAFSNTLAILAGGADPASISALCPNGGVCRGQAGVAGSGRGAGVRGGPAAGCGARNSINGNCAGNGPCAVGEGTCPLTGSAVGAAKQNGRRGGR